MFPRHEAVILNAKLEGHGMYNDQPKSPSGEQIPEIPAQSTPEETVKVINGVTVVSRRRTRGTLGIVGGLGPTPWGKPADEHPAK